MSPLWKETKHSLEYLGLRSVLGSLAITPRPLRQASIRLLFKAPAFLKLNALAMRNLDLAYGDSISKTEKKKILDGVYVHLSRIFSELTDYQKQGMRFVEKIVVDDVSTEWIHETLRHGKGAVCVTPHFGNWELLPSWFTLHGYPGALIGKKLKNKKLNEYLEKLRASSQFQVIYQNESPRKILRLLAQNKLIGILPDADTKRLAGVFLRFFGRETYTPTGPASLSIVSGAPIVPIFLAYENGKYQFFAEKPIYPKEGDRSEEELRRLSQYWSDCFEKVIRKYPDQWIWFQRRWVNQPQNR